MATRGQIAYLADPNTIFSIYIHYDAYPENLSKILNTHFNSDEQAGNLVMDGNDIRSIDDDGTVDRFDKGGAKQIRSEEPEDLFNYLYDHADSNGADYVYVWLEDKWVDLKISKGRQYFVGTLLDQIRKSEPTMNESYTNATNNELASYIGTLKNQIGSEENPKKLEMLKQDLKDIKLELEKRKSTKENSHYVTNEEADEDARMNEDYQKRLWQHRAGIIK
jgi:hypothetical protein